jgi:cytochrome c oxidase cbb3-type subunit 2
MAFSHQSIEKNTGWLIILTILIVSVGGLVQIVPLFFQRYVTQPVEGLKPYSALELSGRDIYIREGCVGCHSQMVRPFRAETERYGHYSVAGEYIYDRPFLWGSKRTGPDLQRMAGRYSDDWHRAHLTNPRDVVPESNMPAYAFLASTPLDNSTIRQKMTVLKNWAGHPYTDTEIADAPKELEGKTEMDALIAYLQSLGRAMKDVK